MGVHARVRGPHPGERLRYVADDVFHRARSHGFRAGSDVPDAVMLGEQHEERDGVIWHVKQVGADPEAGAETVLRAK